jgi:hypothetical protein
MFSSAKGPSACNEVSTKKHDREALRDREETYKTLATDSIVDIDHPRTGLAAVEVSTMIHVIASTAAHGDLIITGPNTTRGIRDQSV